jgi:hypothetical protein
LARQKSLAEYAMTDQEQAPVEDKSEDSFADALSAIALVVIAVVITVYWVSNQ